MEEGGKEKQLNGRRWEGKIIKWKKVGQESN